MRIFPQGPQPKVGIKAPSPTADHRPVFIARPISAQFGAFALGTAWGYLRLLVVLSGGLLALAIGSLARPSERVNFGLFKYASLYMLNCMLLLAIEAI